MKRAISLARILSVLLIFVFLLPGCRFANMVESNLVGTPESFTSREELADSGYTREKVTTDFWSYVEKCESSDTAHYIYSHVNGKTISNIVPRICMSLVLPQISFIFELDKQGQYGGSAVLAYNKDGKIDVQVSPSAKDYVSGIHGVTVEKKILAMYVWFDIIIIELEDGSYYNCNADKIVANSLDEFREYYTDREWQKESMFEYSA